MPVQSPAQTPFHPAVYAPCLPLVVAPVQTPVLTPVLSRPEVAEVYSQVASPLAKGYIQPSNSPCAVCQEEEWQPAHVH